jgi:(1->4)-alpha-D-glucan 1-alpha-D-glucosylmutase
MRIPTATYRIQFNPSLGFRAARAIVPYLADLGISDIYASPILRARKGSAHGYDVVDPNQLNPDLGEPGDLKSLSEEIKKRGLGWLQDIVPNHMSFDRENQLLMDVLEHGESSKYYRFFDIDWDHPYTSMKGRLLAPFLGQFYGSSLEDREIKLKYGPDGLTVVYGHLRLPLRIESYLNVLTLKLSGLKLRLGQDNPDFSKLLGILYVLKTLPSSEDPQERYDQTNFIKRTLWELYRDNEDVKKFLDTNIRIFNGTKGNPESFNLLDDLLVQQFFRLSYWKVATEEINYRRFFSINELICLRVEDEDVFDERHKLIFGLMQEGIISGLRIDHVDGLYDPTAYLQRLREKVPETYIVVEKILNVSESLPHFWPIQGTTGYDFTSYVNGLFCQKQNEREFNRIYASIAGLTTPYQDLLREKRQLVIQEDMAGDVDNLAHLVKEIASLDRHGSDITLYALRRALTGILAVFPVYRTYISPTVSGESDRAYIRQAVESAKLNNPALLNELTFIQSFLLLDFPEYLSDEDKQRWLKFVMRFQQLTGPLMAKGFEDTTLYIYNRLLSLNEVGGRPNQFGCSIKEFHGFSARRSNMWPDSLNATSTHDTKRGEDVRARINVLTELPEEWKRHVTNWTRINKSEKKRVGAAQVPDRNDEYFLYQTLLGTFPFEESVYPQFVSRIKEYVIKAVREAKVHTGWLQPDTEYEDAYISFVEEILKPTDSNDFLQDFIPFQKRIAHYGIFNSLSQVLIKITCPGVPDFYQGTELWDLNLVDPDNRRPVDFNKRKTMLREIKKRADSNVLGLISHLLSNKEDGRIKLFLIYMALQARNRHREIFQRGYYEPLEVSGAFKDHVVAFGRNHLGNRAITVAPRFLSRLAPESQFPLGEQVWQDTKVDLTDGANSLWKNIFTGEIHAVQNSLLVGEILRHFPVALLIRENSGEPRN